ncbi:hypothetical protein DFQ27_006633 [Actinomortierella ambigua]|uniref:Uncharacterized protein n=1 Tax=Actinomortierella ambigua TaxID=1343610 RepID=A0A9P6PYG1_9FUNG|nr:hypothetical protein DFQ27_006633 [Actinomortierella ambigua]
MGGAFGGAGCYAFFAHQDLRISIQPFTTGKALWYFFAAVSVLGAATGVFGMLATLLANRRMVKAFEAFYVVTLLTHVALIAWALIWIRQRQSDFDMACTNARGMLWLPAFADTWSCATIYRAIAITIGVGGLIWFLFNFYLSNRVIQYARELFEERSGRNYKVLGAAASREMDREQQIPLAYTGAPGTNSDDPARSGGFQHQPSYRDEIEYKNPRTSDVGSPAFNDGYGVQDASMPHNAHAVPAFNHRNSTHGLDLVNPYHQDNDYHHLQQLQQQNEYIPQPPITTTTMGESSTSVAAASYGTSSDNVGSSSGGQSFVHAKTNVIASPFDDDDYSAPPPPVATGTEYLSGSSDSKGGFPSSSTGVSSTGADEPTAHSPPSKAW